MRLAATALSLGSLTAALLLSGCVPPPKGEGTGRVEVTDTTPAERNSREVLPTALQEQADQVATQLAADLSRVPELNEQVRSTIVFGDIVNKTGIVPTTDFEAFRAQVRQNLMQSRVVMNQIRWVEDRSRWEQLRRREGAQGPGSRDLNEDHTFFLNGEMYRVNRGNGGPGDINLYSMGYNLMRLSDGTIIWSSPKYQVKQIR